MGGDDNSRCLSLGIFLIALAMILASLVVLAYGKPVAALICIVSPIVILVGAVPFMIAIDWVADRVKMIKNFLTKSK